MSFESGRKRNLRGVSFAATIAFVMILAGLAWMSPRASATEDVLRQLATKEWVQDSHTSINSVVAVDLDGDGTVEVAVGGASYLSYQGTPRGYLAVFHYGGCCKTLQLLNYKVWDAGLPYPDTAVFSVVTGNFDKTAPGLEIVTAGYTMSLFSGNGYYRGEIRMYRWSGTSLQYVANSQKEWPGNGEPNTYAYSAFASDVDGDGVIEVITAGSYGAQTDLETWYWTGTDFHNDGFEHPTNFIPAAWKGVSAGDVDGNPATVEIVAVGYGTQGGDIVGLIKVWNLIGGSLFPRIGPGHSWTALGHIAIANGTYIGPLDDPGDIRILTVGSTTTSGGKYKQEMKVFDWYLGSFTNMRSQTWEPTPSASLTRGTGAFILDVDQDSQYEAIAVGFSKTSNLVSADLSIWHWNGPGNDILLDNPISSWTTWIDSYRHAIADGLFVGDVNGDGDHIPEIVTGGTVTYAPGTPPPPAVREAQMKVWDWNLQMKNVWVSYTQPGPSGRFEHAMAYYASAQRTILFGGSDFLLNLFNDTWRYDAHGHVWDTVALSGFPPSARREHAMIYDTAHDRIILFGGMATGSVRLQDTWEFEYGSPYSYWRQVTITPGSQIPTPRYAPAMAYDEAHGATILFGGSEDGGNMPTTTYMFQYGTAGPQTGTWSIRTPTGGPPAGRIEHVMANDCKRGRIVLYGGSDGTYDLSDTWEYEYNPGGVDRWIPAPIGPSGREAPAMSYDVQGEAMVLFGGLGGGVYHDETYTYDGSAWTLRTSTPHPGGQFELAMAYDMSANREVIFSGPSSIRETWEYRYY